MPARLVDDELGTLYLDRAHGFGGVKIDPGFPAVRAKQQSNVNASGVSDTTRLTGSRAVSVTALVLPAGGRTRRAILDDFRAFCDPARRPVLIFDEERDGTERRMVLRGANAGTPFQTFARTVQGSWEAPSGLIEAATLESVTISAVPASSPGVQFPIQFPLVFPKYPTAGAQGVLNRGKKACAPLYRLWGPCTNPKLLNVDTGALIAVGGGANGTLTLTADQYVEVDVAGVTYRLNGRANDNLQGYVDLFTTRLAYLAPGTNRVRYAPATFDTGAHADVLYRSAWI